MWGCSNDGLYGAQGEAGQFQQRLAQRERDVAMLEADVTQVRCLRRTPAEGGVGGEFHPRDLPP